MGEFDKNQLKTKPFYARQIGGLVLDIQNIEDRVYSNSIEKKLF